MDFNNAKIAPLKQSIDLFRESHCRINAEQLLKLLKFCRNFCYALLLEVSFKINGGLMAVMANILRYLEEWKVLNSNRSLPANEIQADHLTVNRQPVTAEI